MPLTGTRILAFFAVFFSALCFPVFADEPYSETRPLLGTYVVIRIQDPDKTVVRKKEIAREAFKEIERVENLLSNFKNDNVIYAINHSGASEMPLDDETFYVLKRAKYFNGVSSGAFDVTVLPLLEIWGFYGKEHVVPSDEAIKNTLSKIGSDKIILDPVKKTVRLSEPGMEIDLGGIAAGYAVDRAVGILRANQVISAIVDAGGDIYCLGEKQKNRAWGIGIRDPLKKGGITEKIELEDMAVTTSGGYEKFFKAGGKTYSHIMDPRTGSPVQNNLLSVTVIAEDCLTADALATAAMVMGKEGARGLIDSLNGVRAVIISRDGKRVKKEHIGGKKEKKPK